MLIRLITIAFLFALAASQASADTDRRFVNGARSAERAPLPFSDGVLVGDTLYIAGHIGIDPKSDRAAEDPRIEAKFVMDRVKATVESAGLTMDDVVLMQVFCTDLPLYDTFNEVYRNYFPHGSARREEASSRRETRARGTRFFAELMNCLAGNDIPVFDQTQVPTIPPDRWAQPE